MIHTDTAMTVDLSPWSNRFFVVVGVGNEAAADTSFSDGRWLARIGVAMTVENYQCVKSY
jgi:hypothetical protein